MNKEWSNHIEENKTPLFNRNTVYNSTKAISQVEMRIACLNLIRLHYELEQEYHVMSQTFPLKRFSGYNAYDHRQ